MQWRTSTDGTTVVSDAVKMLPIDENTPRRKMLILGNRQRGKTTVGVLPPGQVKEWDCWFPFPTFAK